MERLMPGAAKPLTYQQVQDFYRALPFADSAAALVRRRFQMNLKAIIRQQKKSTAEEAQQLAVDARDRMSELSTSQLNGITLLLMLRESAPADETCDGDSVQSAVHRRLCTMFAGKNRIRPYTFPSATLDGMNGVRFEADDSLDFDSRAIVCFAESIIRQEILPLVKHPGDYAVECVRVLMATAVLDGRCGWTTVDEANRFFAECCDRFIEQRDLEVKQFSDDWIGELVQRVERWAPQQYRDEVVSRFLSRLVEDLKKPTNPDPAIRFTNERMVFGWAKRVTTNLIKDVIGEEQKNPLVGLEPALVVAPDGDETERSWSEDNDLVKQPLWRIASGILNETLQQSFEKLAGPDALVSCLSAAHSHFQPGAVIAVLMQLRVRGTGKSEQAAYQEIGLALSGDQATRWTQFVDTNGAEASPAQLWEHCGTVWNSILRWDGELPRLQLPQSWSEVRGLFPAESDTAAERLKSLHAQWEDYARGLIHLRLGNCILQLTSILTRDAVYQMLTASGSGRETVSDVSSDRLWRQVTRASARWDFPEIWQTARAWFAGQIRGDVDSLIRKFVDRGLKKSLAGYWSQKQGRTDPPSTRTNEGWRTVAGHSPECASDVIHENDAWYVAMVTKDEPSGRCGVRVLRSRDGDHWEQTGHTIVQDGSDLTLPRFVRAQPIVATGSCGRPDIQCDVRDVETRERSPVLSRFCTETESWLPVEPIGGRYRFLSRVIWHEDLAYVLARSLNAAGRVTTSLLTGGEITDLRPACELPSTGLESNTQDGPADDFEFADSATLFFEDGELWVVMHCAGADWRRTWLGVSPQAELSGWVWTQASTAVYPDYRFIIPDARELEVTENVDCALSPAATCRLPDGTLWLSGVAHVAGQRNVGDVLCRVFLPENVQRNTSDGIRPVFCPTKRLGTSSTGGSRHTGLDTDGSRVIASCHRNTLSQPRVPGGGNVDFHDLLTPSFPIFDALLPTQSDSSNSPTVS